MMSSLHTRRNDRAFVAKVGLCRGLLASSVDLASIQADLRNMMSFLSDGDGDSGFCAKGAEFLRRALALAMSK
jgi:hypothetical protein